LHLNEVFMYQLSFLLPVCRWFAVPAAFLVWISVCSALLAQTTPAQSNQTPPAPTSGFTEDLKSSEFSIPTSPAFILLGANPDVITRPGITRDFKVDWSFRSYSLQPNLAIEAQPVWEILYNRPTLAKYRNAHWVMRTLSTLSASFGTVQDSNSNQQMAWALKLNLFREKDPLMERGMYANAEREFKEQAKNLDNQIRETAILLKTTRDMETKAQLEQQLADLNAQYAAMELSQKDRIKTIAQQYVKENWNASFIDVAFGKRYNYLGSGLKELQMQGAGTGVWVNGSIGIGKKMLASAMVKYTRLDIKMPPLLQDTVSIEQPDSVAKSHLIGFNWRYGNPRYNFFLEVASDSPNMFLGVGDYYFAGGGDFRIGRNLLLNFALRTVLNDKFHFKTILPIATLACLMR